MKILISITAIFLLFFGCNSNPADSSTENNFLIFLTKDIENNSPTYTSLDKLILEDEPILSTKSIESYVWSKHKITFSDEAKNIIKLKEPLFGRFFVVISSNQRIYWGLFTDGLSSMGCNNPVIMVLSRGAMKGTSLITNEFIIERAYPEYIGNENDKDLREDPRIYNALKVSHKLK
jgi:hypothetical protein